MERIYPLTLSKVDFDDLRKVLNIVIFRPPIHFDKYYARRIPTAEISNETWYEVDKFGVHDLNHNMLGVFKIKDLSNTTIISFNITDIQYLQAFLDYFQWIIKEMKLAGITILDTHGFGEETINPEIGNEPYLSKIEGAFEKSVEDTANSINNDKSDDASEEDSKQADKPWEQIDESEEDKKLIRLIYEGISREKIAEIFDCEQKTISNRATKLRKLHGLGIVPSFANWRNLRYEENRENKIDKSGKSGK